jgi:thiosulfate/3-mercaptopyruvate sulfurtransferase
MSLIPVDQRGYANSQYLAETDWLAGQLNNPNLRVVDARPPQQYAAGHIPGAVNLSGFGGIPRAANGDMAGPEDFARVAGSLGIGNDATIVVYDAPSQMMGMVAWAFLYYGHQDVRLLDGGYHKWTQEGRPVSAQAANYPQTVFNAKPVEAIYCSLSQAKSFHGRPQKIFWDTRSQAEYQGTAAAPGEPPPRLGRIPDAIHLEWAELLDPATKTLKPAAELRALLESKGITPDCEIGTY